MKFLVFVTPQSIYQNFNQRDMIYKHNIKTYKFMTAKNIANTDATTLQESMKEVKQAYM